MISEAAAFFAHAFASQFDASHMEFLRDASTELLPRVDAGGQTAMFTQSAFGFHFVWNAFVFGWQARALACHPIGNAVRHVLLLSCWMFRARC